jgi:hypothetical protein
MAGTGAGRSTVVDLHTLVTSDRGGLVGAAWRWRTELAASFAAWLAWIHTGLTMLLLGLGVFVGLVLVVAPIRRRVLARLACTLMRHRLYALFHADRLHNRRGQVPLILSVRPTPTGSKAVVWCRPGICVDDLTARMEEIAAACWARTSRITRSIRFAHLVTIEIVRRDPLAAAHVIPSPLAGGPRPDPTTPVSEPATDLDDSELVVPLLTLIPGQRVGPDDDVAGDGEPDAA